MRHIPRWARIALWIVLLVAVLDLCCYFVQGGFGGGHGRFDGLMAITGFPWIFVPWPSFMYARDIVWLILVPLGIDATVIVAIAVAVTKWRKAGSKG